MNSVGADKPMRLWHLTWKKGVMEKTTKFFEKTCTPPVEKSFGEAFSDLFQDKWWRPQTEEIDNSEGVFFWSCYTFPPQVTLGCTPWVAFPTQVHPAEFLGSWKAVDCLVNLVRWQWARHWAHCSLCVTQQECPEPLRVQEASAWIECPCYIRALYLIHKQFILPLLSLGESWIVTCDYCNWMAGCNLRAVTCIPMLS